MADDDRRSSSLNYDLEKALPADVETHARCDAKHRALPLRDQTTLPVEALLNDRHAEVGYRSGLSRIAPLIVKTIRPTRWLFRC